MPRSLKVAQKYLEKVRLALLRNGFPSQKALALELGLALSTVSRFFTSKPVDYSTFVDICDRLDLDWHDISDLGLNVSLSPEIEHNTPSLELSSETENAACNGTKTLLSQDKLSFPEGAIPANSPLYQSRENIESVCHKVVLKPASLIRIKAPMLMGKTSLIVNILASAQSHNYQTVYLDLANVEKNILTDLDKFLRWLSFMVGKQLGLANQLDSYWDLAILGSNSNCTAYFEEYLLPTTNCPVVLALDEVDRLFSYNTVVEDFLGMLRSWHEKGKIFPIWQNLRLIVAHSTEVYISLDLNQSPFNAGVPIELLEFNVRQIQNLATVYQLDWSESEISQLRNTLGGHPYLIQLAMYRVSNGDSLEQLLENASKETGVYNFHLRGHLELLKQKPALAKSFKQVVMCDVPVALKTQEIYQLYSMGLVQLKDNRVMPRCKLYRDYFSRVL